MINFRWTGSVTVLGKATAPAIAPYLCPVGNCSCVALGLFSRLDSTSFVLELVPPTHAPDIHIPCDTYVSMHIVRVGND